MKIVIAFITYNQSSFKYLPFFLPSLKEAVDDLEIDYQILVLDNSEDFKGNKNYLSDFFRDNNLEKKSEIYSLDFNSGFAKGFNFLINKAIENGANLFMAINPDVLLDKKAISSLVKKFQIRSRSEKIGSLGSKILTWDFANNKKTKIIDSLGIGMSVSHRFFDIRQGEEDDFLCQEKVFGLSGAAVVYNIEALKNIAFNNGRSLEFFDELMFMYKEDIDLSYRLRLAAWESFLVPESFIYHDRSLSSHSCNFFKLIFGKKDNFRSLSYLNQMIIFLKFRKIKFSFRIKVLSFIRFIFLFFYGLIFNFKQIKKLFNLWPEIEKRRKDLKIEERNIKEIESLTTKA